MDREQFFEALRTRFSDAIPHSRECGIRVDRLDQSGATASMDVRPEWLGDTERALVHTGIITTLIDTVSGLAVLAGAGRFEGIATLDLRVDYLRAAGPDGRLHSRAECYRLTRSIAFVRAWAWQHDESTPVAVSQSTFMRSSGAKGRASGPV